MPKQQGIHREPSFSHHLGVILPASIALNVNIMCSPDFDVSP